MSFFKFKENKKASNPYKSRFDAFSGDDITSCLHQLVLACLLQQLLLLRTELRQMLRFEEHSVVLSLV
jgi:hypothetical protein